jgi:hypothetical protein
LTDRLLLSHDIIGYDPALSGGGDPQPYSHLTEGFLPLLRAAGVDEETPHHYLGQPVAFVRTSMTIVDDCKISRRAHRFVPPGGIEPPHAV